MMSAEAPRYDNAKAVSYFKTGKREQGALSNERPFKDAAQRTGCVREATYDGMRPHSSRGSALPSERWDFPRAVGSLNAEGVDAYHRNGRKRRASGDRTHDARATKQLFTLLLHSLGKGRSVIFARGKGKRRHPTDSVA